MEIFFTVTIISFLLTPTCFASDTSGASIQSEGSKSPESSAEEMMSVAENVVFRPYFQHHIHHGAHHHSHHHAHTHPHTPGVVSLESVDPVSSTKVESNLVRRSYATGTYPSYASPNYVAGIYPSLRPAVAQSWYGTSKPVSRPYYPYASGSNSVAQNCYYPPLRTSQQKLVDRSYLDYYNQVPGYYGSYNGQYARL